MRVKKILKRFLQVFLILGFVIVAGFLVWFLNATKPVAEEKKIVITRPVVEVIPVTFDSTTIEVASQGVVQPKKQTQLASELSGKVNWISENFTVGGRFEEEEIILEIDPTDYNAAVAEAEAALVEAEVSLTTEKARATQAERDWKRLGKGRPSSLTLREPQIRNANSRVSAAKSALERAKKNLERTVIKAPFMATVSAKSTEIGNYLAPGSPIGEFFQTEPLEVRLPLPLEEIRFLNSTPEGEILGDMVIATTLGNKSVEWNARIDRTEGQIDQQSRSIILISDIVTDQKSGTPIRLQPGLFLTATISGKTYRDVARIPAAAFLDLNQVVLVDENDKLEFREVDVLRRVGDYVYVTGGLEEGEKLCLTELSTMIEGTSVEPRLLPKHIQAGVEYDQR
ncbi:MAG: efflux RND transporter periplasmic adaptor subunit [Verrucomicrobiales bacterium]|nr:efflux RND transporter periplasmic adaptor subunit [Verrucomicrobiales bacterium]